MARMLNWTAEDRIPELRNVGMNRLVAAAEVIKRNAIKNLQVKITGVTKVRWLRKDGAVEKTEPWKEHGVYATGKYAGKIWTERHYREMINTVRVVRKNGSDDRDVRIYAGNFKTWWALQMEFGHGDWHGGAKSFLRPAMNGSISEIKAVIESGNAETETGKVANLSEKVNLNNYGSSESVYQKYTNW